MSARILSLDIETAPSKGVFWGIWQQNIGIDAIQDDWYILCYAASWLGSGDVLYDSLVRYPKDYKKDPQNDYSLLLTLHDLLDEADIVIAHNGKRFDIPKINARFLKAGISPPSPYRMIDTLKTAKSQFALTSNKLDYIAKFLGLGRKIDTGGIDLWLGCMSGDRECWKKMVDYNIQDVILLEKVYLKLRPWMVNHPNLSLYNDEEEASCPKCGSVHLRWDRTISLLSGVYKRFQCNDCGGWGRARTNELSAEKRKGLMANANSNN